MSDPNIHTELGADGILLARIDMPGRAMNVFSRDMMDSLESLLDRVAEDTAVRGVVLTSGKAAFLAGADLEMIKMFAEVARTGSDSELRDLFGHLGRLFLRLDQSPKPFVAAINGLALGGGLELGLACHSRVVADDASIQLGLPEIKLGLLPGAGGTQRLPRLIGTAKGMQMLLSGEPVSPQEALDLKLVDAIVPASELLSEARRLALAGKPQKDDPDMGCGVINPWPFDFSSPEAASTAIAAHCQIDEYRLSHYPAYRAIMSCVIGGWKLPMAEACEHEMRIFVGLMRDPVAGNMVRTLFLNRQKAAKRGLLAAGSPLSSGSQALLPRLKEAREQAAKLGCNEDETLLALAFTAVRVWDDNQVEQPELADVAVVSAGLYPSYTGGPFTYTRQTGLDTLGERARSLAAKDPTLFAVPSGLERLLQAAG